MKKYRETKYYITFDIETMEELVILNLNEKNKEKRKHKGKQLILLKIMLLNPNNEEKQTI
jgi:hypothetical protein